MATTTNPTLEELPFIYGPDEDTDDWYYYPHPRFDVEWVDTEGEPHVQGVQSAEDAIALCRELLGQIRRYDEDGKRRDRDGVTWYRYESGLIIDDVTMLDELGL